MFKGKTKCACVYVGVRVNKMSLKAQYSSYFYKKDKNRSIA